MINIVVNFFSTNMMMIVIKIIKVMTMLTFGLAGIQDSSPPIIFLLHHQHNHQIDDQVHQIDDQVHQIDDQVHQNDDEVRQTFLNIITNILYPHSLLHQILNTAVFTPFSTTHAKIIISVIIIFLDPSWHLANKPRFDLQMTSSELTWQVSHHTFVLFTLPSHKGPMFVRFGPFAHK